MNKMKLVEKIVYWWYVEDDRNLMTISNGDLDISKHIKILK